MKNKLDLIIGLNIRARRKALGLTQNQLAVKCGLTAMTINRVELGQRQIRRTNLHDIATALECEEIDLVTNEDIVKGEFSKSADVLLHLENLEPDLRKLALALIYKRPSLASDVSIDLSKLISTLQKKAK